MKIAMILTNEFDPDVRVYKEAKYLVGRGHSVTILCWYKNNSKNYPLLEKKEGICIVRFDIPAIEGSGKKQIPAYIRFIKECRRYLRQNSVDIIHCNDIDGAITGILSKHNLPMVFDMHEFYERGNYVKRWIWRNLTIFLLNKSIAGLYENAAYLGENYRRVTTKLYSLRNYPDADMVTFIPKTSGSAFRVCYHGTLRNQIPEFKALFEAVKDLKDVDVEINGGGVDLAELKILQQGYENVHLNGPYDGTTDSTKLYSETDVLFCGYNPDNPNYQGDAEVVKYYEAICTGTPIIMTKGIGMGSKVENNGFGIACDTRNPSELRAAILRLKEDRAFWNECSNNELTKSGNYRWETEVKVLDAVYRV